MTLCLKEALQGPSAAAGAEPAASYVPALEWLAERVAFNRERGGFHYRSDSRAGKHLATECLKFLAQPPASTTPPSSAPAAAPSQPPTTFAGLLQNARAEWQGFPQPGPA